MGQTRIDGNDEHQLNETAPSKVVQSLPWGSQKTEKNIERDG